MKKFFYILTVFGLISLNGFGQSSEQTDPADDQRAGGGGNKPVIDNISANSVNESGSDIMIKPAIDDMLNNGTSGQNNNNSTNKAGVNDLLKATDEEIAANVKRNLKFYPNPAVNFLNIDLGVETQVEISLINIIGQEVFTQEGEMQKLKISVSDFPEGTYFLSIKIGNEVIVKRIEVS